MQKMISIPEIKVAAADDAALKAKREELKRNLLNGGRVVVGKDGDVTGKPGETSNIQIDSGVKLAADDAALKAKREELKRKLLNGGRVVVGKDGDVTGKPGETSNIQIDSGVKLAAGDDASLKAKREELKRKLLNGESVGVGKKGSVIGKDGEMSTIKIDPKIKLASQWYETDPELLEIEKVAMQRAFNGFQLGRLDDGRLYWYGNIEPGIYETKFHEKRVYTIMAVYQNNHPHQEMGSSVHVYPVSPDIDEIKRECGFRPYHLLVDSAEQEYLCTNGSDNVKTGRTTTSAATVIAWAVRWFMSYELVLTGELTREQFCTHGVI